jgi:hypothetical protein
LPGRTTTLTTRYFGHTRETPRANFVYSTSTRSLSGFLSIAAEFGLPPGELLQHVVTQVSNELRPEYERATALVLAVLEGTEGANKDTHFETRQEAERFAKALLNLGVYLVRQAALRLRLTEEQVYRAATQQLAME